MEARIFWRVHIRAARDVGRQRVLEKVVHALGAATALDAFEPYWKDRRDHVASLTTALGPLSIAEGVLETFTRAGCLRPHWDATVPQVELDRTWSFDLVATAAANGGGFSVPGVVFVSVSAFGGPAAGG